MKQNAKWNLLRGLFCLALMLSLTLGMVPGMMVTARADVDWKTWSSSQNNPPSAADYYKVEGTIDLNSDWTVPNGTTTLWLTETGKITLGNNKSIKVAEGATLEIVSESTGTIESNSISSAITVDGTFKMHGGKINGKSTMIGSVGVVSINNGEFTMTGGTIEATENYGLAVTNSSTFTMTGGEIQVGQSGTGVQNEKNFTMSGGEIQVGQWGTGVQNEKDFSMSGGTINANGQNGVAVSNSKTFTMTGGTINATQDYAMGVVNKGTNSTLNLSGDAKINASYCGVENGDIDGYFVGGTVTMSGGQIIGQRAEESNGVASTNGTFTMTGGEISNFKNGVFINMANFTMDKTGSGSSDTISGNNIGVYVSQGTFNMKAGKIQNNAQNGVSVMSSGEFKMSGGAITGNGQYGVEQSTQTAIITLSGQVEISGNTSADIFCYILQNNPGNIIIKDALACDKPINVSGNPVGLQNHVFTSGFSKTGSSDPSKYFKCGVTGYGLYVKDNEVAFGQSVTVTFDKNSNEATGTMEAQNIVKGVETELSAGAFTRPKYKFDGWNTAAGGTGTKYADKARVTLSADTTLYAIWTQMPAATVTRAPAANNLTYTGSAQKLVTAGEATGGEMQYALGDNATTAPDASAFTASIPAKTDAGTYYVWYKVKGDENHSDAAPAGPVTVTINAAGLKILCDPENGGRVELVSSGEDYVGYTAIPAEGWKFQKWTYNANVSGIGPQEFSGKDAFFMFTATDVVAHFVKGDDEIVTITFDAAGGTGTMAPVQIEKESKYTFPNSSFIPPADKAFAHWKIGEKSYAVNETITVNADLTVTAVWTEEKSEDKESKIVQNGLTSVPDELKNKFSSVKDLKDALLRAILSKGMFASEENSVFYDVVLMVRRNGGSWERATKEDFEDGPLTVKLEYPAGTGKNTHNFTVVHMFTANTPGKIETPAVTKKEDGIYVNLDGLSPVAISWTKIDEKAIDSLPQTGDTERPLIYGLVALAACIGVGLLIKKK